MHLFQDRDEVGKLNMERFALCSVWYSYMRLCMSRLVELLWSVEDQWGRVSDLVLQYELHREAVGPPLPPRRSPVLARGAAVFEHRGIALSPVWYARAGAAAAPSSLPSRDRVGVWVGLEPTTTVRDLLTGRAPPLSSLWPRGRQVRI